MGVEVLANSRFESYPFQRLFQGRVLGIIFSVLGIVLSLLMASILLDHSNLDGIKMAVAMLIGGVSLIWFLTTERIGLALLLLIVFLGVFEGYFKIMSTGATFFVVYAIRSILTLALIMNLVFKRAQRRLDEIGIHFEWPPFSLLIGFYVLWVLLNIFHPDGINLMNSIAGIRPHIEFIPFYFIGYIVCKKDPQWYIHLLVTLVIIGVLNAVAAIHQYKIGPEALPQVWGSGYGKLVADVYDGPTTEPQTMRDKIAMNARVYNDQDYNIQLRPPGLGSDHTYPAMVAQIAIFSVLALLFYYLQTRNYWILGFLILSVVLLFAGIVVSASRSYLLLTIIGLAMGLLFYTREILSGQKLKIVVLLIIAGTVLGSHYAVKSYLSENVYDRFQNVSTPQKLAEQLEAEKFSNWAYTKRYLLENPLGRGLGKVGPGSAFFATNEDDVVALGNGETEINFFLSELGVVGLLIFYAIVIGTLLKSVVAMRSSSPNSYQRMASMIVLLYLLVFLINSLWGTGATFPTKASIWLLMGCFWAFHNQKEVYFLPPKPRQW